MSQAHLIATAEKVRTAGRLLEEAAQMLHPGAVAEDYELHKNARLLAGAASALWGALAAKAGGAYLEGLRGNDTPRLLLQLGAISGQTMLLDKVEFARFLDSPGDFAYLREAHLIMQLRQCLDGEPVKGEA